MLAPLRKYTCIHTLSLSHKHTQTLKTRGTCVDVGRGYKDLLSPLLSPLLLHLVKLTQVWQACGRICDKLRPKLQLSHHPRSRSYGQDRPFISFLTPSLVLNVLFRVVFVPFVLLYGAYSVLLALITLRSLQYLD
jgi:hypothetical protein